MYDIARVLTDDFAWIKDKFGKVGLEKELVEKLVEKEASQTQQQQTTQQQTGMGTQSGASSAQSIYKATILPTAQQPQQSAMQSQNWKENWSDTKQILETLIQEQQQLLIQKEGMEKIPGEKTISVDFDNAKIFQQLVDAIYAQTKHEARLNTFTRDGLAGIIQQLTHLEKSTDFVDVTIKEIKNDLEIETEYTASGQFAEDMADAVSKVGLVS